MKKTMKFIGIILFFCGLSGCTMHQKITLVDQNWGRSYETARFSQIINPEAGDDMAMVMGLDGVAAKNNYDTYQNDFKKQESSSQIVNINLGGN